MKKIQNTAWQIEWLYTTDFPNRAVPLVILSDGNPGYTINQWIRYLLESDITPSLLDRHIRANMQLYEFYHRTYGNRALTENESNNLLSCFFNAKKNGSDLMGWKPNINKPTLVGYLSSITEFDKWHSTFHGAQRLNPTEKKFLSTWEIYRDFQRRTKWDVMLHLFPSKTHKKEVSKQDYRLHVGHKRFHFMKKNIPKAFPIERFVDLIEKTPNPRDKMLWLVMGGGSLRRSEPLHLFHQDVLEVDELGSTRIRLDDPEIGVINWEINGKHRTGTREDYLSECYVNEDFKKTIPDLYRLAPRTKAKQLYKAGFKGMTFSIDPATTLTADGRIIDVYDLFWCDPRFGIRFQTAYEEYIHEYFRNQSSKWPYHPWLFITLDKNKFGYPMTLEAMRKAWKRALKRIGMENCGLSEHSLRHMFGAYCASVLRLPLETTRSLMHHANATSTEVYYHLQQKDVKDAITKAVIENAGINILDYIIMPDTPRIQTPDNWIK